MPKKKPPSPVQLAANIYGCDVSDLLAFHEFDDGSVAIIAPTGQKFTYPAECLLQAAAKPAAPAPVAATHATKPIPSPPPKDGGRDAESRNAESRAAESNSAGKRKPDESG